MLICAGYAPYAADRMCSTDRRVGSTTLSWNADDVDDSTELYNYSADDCWPGIDSVAQSYYQYEIGK